MSATAESFVLDLSAFRKKAKGNMDLLVRKVVLDLGTRIVMRSPVGDGTLWKNPPPKGYVGGRFRANWQYGLDAPVLTTVNSQDASGAKTVAKIAISVPVEAGGFTHYITNNLPYAIPLERGWSKQAPSGMVGLAVREYQGLVAKYTREINS